MFQENPYCQSNQDIFCHLSRDYTYKDNYQKVKLIYNKFYYFFYLYDEDINKLKELHDFAEIIPISATKNDNVDLLINCIKKQLDDQERIFSEEELTNVTTRFIMAEFVREKVLELTHDEIPHTVTCYVENYEEDDKVVHIQVLIVVDRDNIKKIIIGKQGSMLKEIGTRARIDMENFLGKKVFLETYVKTLKNWRDQERYFVELGLKDEDE